MAADTGEAGTGAASGGDDVEPNQPTPAEELEEAMKLKDRGTELYKEGKHAAARDAWLLAMRTFPKDEAKSLSRFELSLHLNLAQVLLLIKDWKEAAAHADEALALDPENSKAIFRRGLAYGGAGMYREAAVDLLKAARLEPRSKEIRAKYEEFKAKAQELEDAGEEAAPPEHNVDALPRAFLDVAIGDAAPRRLLFALYADTTPKTVENFRKLCTGEHPGVTGRGRPFSYKGCLLHRMIPGLMVQGGDFENSNGTGGESIYGRRFPDEFFGDKHVRRGLLAMANDGPNTNGSNFFVSFEAAEHLNKRHVIFGELVEGWELLGDLEKLETNPEYRPIPDCVIVDCGEGVGS